MKSTRVFALILVSTGVAGAQSPTGSISAIFNTESTTQTALASSAPLSYVIAHFPYGGGWSTRVLLANSGTADATVNITFFNQAGAPTLVPLQGAGNQGSQQIVVHPNDTQVVGAELSERTAGSLHVAWATATSSAPLNVFSLFDFGTSSSVIAGAVGAQSTPPAKTFRFPVSVGGPLNFNFGLAIANPNSTPTAVMVKVLNTDGTFKGTFQENLAPNAQTLFTLPSKISFDSSTLFNGAVAVCASQPVGLVTVGFEGGAFFSASVTNDPCP
jgi:hypothetical protein